MANNKVTKNGKEAKISTVEPIKSKKDIQRIIQWFIINDYKKYAILFKLGCYTGLRISDLIQLKVKDIYHKTKVYIREQKTAKVKVFPLQPKLQHILNDFCINRNEEEYVFHGKDAYKPLHTSQVYKMINDACIALKIEANVGTHSMRKTFGYHHYKQFNDIGVLQEIFNHSSPDVTQRYIGISQDEMDDTYLALDLEDDDDSLDKFLRNGGNNRTRIKAITCFLRTYLQKTNRKGIHTPFADILLEIIAFEKAYEEKPKMPFTI